MWSNGSRALMTCRSGIISNELYSSWPKIPQTKIHWSMGYEPSEKALDTFSSLFLQTVIVILFCQDLLKWLRKVKINEMRAESASRCKTRNVALFSHQTKIAFVDLSRTTLLQREEKTKFWTTESTLFITFRQTSSHWVTFYFGFHARADGCSDMHYI